MSLPRYPEYKDSGVPWLGNVPASWGIHRLKDIAAIINGYPFDSKLFEAGGSYPLVRIRDLDSDVTATRYSGEFVQAAAVTSSDVLIGMDGDFNVGQWRGSEVALLNQRMCCVRVESDELSTFLRHALPIPLSAINDVTYSTTVKHLSSLDVEKIRLALPKESEDVSAISTFLDHETGKIDVLIAEQEALIALLAEKRQATISDSVTRGLNPNASMKYSGVTWLGEMPAHWEVRPLGFLCKSISYGFTNPMPTTEDGPYLLTANDVAMGRVNYETARRTSFTAYQDELTQKSRPRANDIFITKDGTLGRVALFDGRAACINQSVASLRIDFEVALPKFLAIALSGSTYQERMKCDAGGTTIKHIYISRLGKMQMAIPPLVEQATIVSHLETELAKLDTLNTEAERSVALLRERRSALVAATVTGQIDVRNALHRSTPQ